VGRVVQPMVAPGGERGWLGQSGRGFGRGRGGGCRVCLRGGGRVCWGRLSGGGRVWGCCVCVCVRGGWCGRLAAAAARLRYGEVAAALGALEQDVVERGGAEDAAADVSEDDSRVAGAEMPGDEVEAGGGGAAVEGFGEVAAVGEEDGDDAKDDREIGQSSGVPVLDGIGWGGLERGRAGCCVCHVRRAFVAFAVCGGIA